MLHNDWGVFTCLTSPWSSLSRCNNALNFSPYNIKESNNLRIIVSLQEVSLLPTEFVARHWYVPSSSGNTSEMLRVATQFLYLRDTTSEEAKASPFLNQATRLNFNILLKILLTINHEQKCWNGCGVALFVLSVYAWVSCRFLNRI